MEAGQHPGFFQSTYRSAADSKRCRGGELKPVKSARDEKKFLEDKEFYIFLNITKLGF